ncbi:MAG TPA: FAD-dependent oxidoreductase [Bacteroidota bacterium]|nr:FAD-dependent oxidoreductase [Bacteroidota bacterium]
MLGNLENEINKEQFDVAVIGGGPSGFSAAVAAARAGANVLLVERREFLGGVATASMFQPWRGFHSFGRQVVNGIGEEIVQRLQAAGGSPGHLVDPTGISFTVTPFDGDLLIAILRDFAATEHVSILLGAQCTGVRMIDRDIAAITIGSKRNETTLHARVYVDATGDGFVAVKAGAKSIHHEATASWRFSMSRVDKKAVLDFAQRNPHEFSKGPTTEDSPFFSLKGFSSFTKKWQEHIPALRKRDSIQMDGAACNDDVVISMIELPGVNPDDSESLLRARMRCDEIVPKGIKLLAEDIPGFKNADLHRVASELGFHAQRQVAGLHAVSDSDVISGRMFDDAVATCAMPGRPAEIFQVPESALCVPSVRNLFVTGRCVLPPTALFSTNAQPASFQLGEAAGKKAAEAALKFNTSRQERR